MPIKYIGKTTDFKGKTLWEILGNLKNFGVGRMVIRSRFQRYPEPCFMRILKVVALPTPIDQHQEKRKVMTLVQRTFRGETHSTPIQLDSASYKSDYCLIPKDQEEWYLSRLTSRPVKKMPPTMEFPPLFREVLIQEAKSKGITNPEEPRLPIQYNLGGYIKKYDVAKDGDKPDVDIVVGLGKPAYPELYKNTKAVKSS